MFFIQENVAFNLSVTQSIPTSNKVKQLMKTKLRTFARKQILHKPIKKHTIILLCFYSDFMIYFFVYNVFQTSCFFFLEKSSQPHMSKVADTFLQLSVLIETSDIPYFFGYKTRPKLFNAIFLS